MQNNSAKL